MGISDQATFVTVVESAKSVDMFSRCFVAGHQMINRSVIVHSVIVHLAIIGSVNNHRPAI